MKRINVNVSDYQYEFLRNKSFTLHKSVSQIIRFCLPNVEGDTVEDPALETRLKEFEKLPEDPKELGELVTSKKGENITEKFLQKARVKKAMENSICEHGSKKGLCRKGCK